MRRAPFAHMRGFRIGRLFGIDLRVDWSWVLIFVLLTWNLVAVFAHWHPDWSPVGSLAVATCASLLFFGCVVLHELAHSVVAISYGMRVRSITLFLFGGVSNIEREPPSAKAEFLMAVAGPAMSIALGVAVLVVAGFATRSSMAGAASADEALGAVAQLGPVATLLLWLGPINVTIGVFNLVPGFPLDGGRVLRSLLWSVTGDFHKATRIASGVGQGIGWAFIAVGIAMSFGLRVPFFGTGLAGGLWLAFIGWFLHGAAVQASTRLGLDDALAGLTVEQIMRRDGPTVRPETSVEELVHTHLVRGDERALPVVGEGQLLGLVSFASVRPVAVDRWPVTRVGDVMRPLASVTVVRPEQPLAQAFEQLAHQNIEQMPVVEGGRLVGMLHRHDVARWLELAWRPAAAARHPRVGPLSRGV